MGDQKQQQSDKGDWGERENPQRSPRQHSSEKPADKQSGNAEELFKKPYSEKEFERNPAKH
jgi:hypothetical protein